MRLYFKIVLILLSLVLFFILLAVNRLKEDQPKKEVTVLKFESLKQKQSEDYNVWCIFTKVKNENGGHPSIRKKFERMLESLLKNTDFVISLNLVVDASSRYIAKDIVDQSKNVTGKYLKVVYHEVHVLTNKMEGIIEVMQRHFSSQPGAYYSASLFFLSIGLHKFILQSKVLMIDVDTYIKVDIVDLFKEFDQFSNESVIGAVSELTPVYHHILYTYRLQHNGTKLGSPYSQGGAPGINSGVLLLDLDKMRKSQLYQKVLEAEEVDRLTSKYFFKGHLGDQDFYSLLSFEYPSLVHIIDCGWNRQLCSWWKEHGYQDSFDSFAFCPSPIKIYHGNCNSKIP